MPIDIDSEAKQRGLTRVGAELRLVPHPPVKFGTAVPMRARQNIAACSALGLSFWAEHPQTNMLWAADYNGRIHEVRLDRRQQTSAHVCGRSIRFGPDGKMRDAQDCAEVGKTASWLTASTDRELCLQLDGEWINYVEPSKPTAAERRIIKARNERLAAKREAEWAEMDERAYQEAKARPEPRKRSPKATTDDDIDAWAEALADELFGEAS